MINKKTYVFLGLIGIIAIMVLASLIFPGFLGPVKDNLGKITGAIIGSQDSKEFFSCEKALYDKLRIANEELPTVESIEVLEFGNFKKIEQAVDYIKSFGVEDEEDVIQNLQDTISRNQKQITIIVVEHKNDYFVIKGADGGQTPLYRTLYVNTCDGKDLVVLNQ